MISSKSIKYLSISLLLLILYSFSPLKEASIVKHGLCVEGELEPLIVEVDVDEEYLYSYMKWPGIYIPDQEGGSEPFLEWPEKRVGEQILYQSGWMIHKADLTDARIFLRFNLQEETVTGTITGYMHKEIGYPCTTDCPPAWGSNFEEGVCEGWFDASFDAIPIVKTDSTSWEVNKEVTTTLKGYVKAIPSLQHEDYYEDTKTVKLQIPLEFWLYLDGEDVYVDFSFQHTDFSNFSSPTLVVQDNFPYGPCPSAQIVEWKDKASLTISGPDMVSSSADSLVLHLDAQGGLDEVTEFEWIFNYENKERDWVNQATVTQTQLSDYIVQRSGGSPTIEEWHNLTLEQGHRMGNINYLNMSAQVKVFDSQGELLAESNLHKFHIAAMPENRHSITGLDLPMKHMQVLYRDDKQTASLSTDADGCYDLPENDAKPGETYELEIRFAYLVDETEYFVIRASDGDTPVRLQLTIQDERIIQAHLIVTEGKKEFTLDPGPGNVDDLTLDTILTPENGCIAWVSMYIHFTEALEFYKDQLKENMDLQLPLLISSFQPDTVGIHYAWGEKQGRIEIPGKHSLHTSVSRPINREYHEFSHFAMHALYNEWPKPPEGPVKEINHDGYLNPSTADSYFEGFAHFMSMMIAEQHSDRWFGATYSPDVCGVFGSLEKNRKAWEDYGRAEEFAVAGVLWDLYDGEEQNAAEAEAERYKMELLYKNEFLKGGDLNNNGVLEREEFWYVAKADNNMWDICQTDWLHFDDNHDDVLDRDELERIFRIGSQVDASQETSKILDQHDKDGNGKLDENELMNMIRLQEKEKKIEVPDEIKQEFPETITLEFWLEYNIKKAEDKVDLTFEEIWSVLRTRKNNFYEVYQAFTAKYPSLKEDIDEIFKSHGFWIDTDSGNGVWDENEPYRNLDQDPNYNEGVDYFVDYPEGGFEYEAGETIGSASNYQRGERRSTEPLPGHFIKVNNSVPFYQVTLIVYENSAELLPTNVYYIQVENDDGLIHVPVPPESYYSTIRVEPIGVDIGSPLSFTSEEFYDSSSSVQQGYFVEHDYRVRGEIPAPPANPLEAASSAPEHEPEPEPEPEPEEEPEPEPRGIPGFPLLALELGVIAYFSLVWRRSL